MKKIVLMAVVALAGFALNADMLLWQVDERGSETANSKYVQLWTSETAAEFWSSSFTQNGNAKEITGSTVEFTVTDGSYKSYFVEYLTYDNTNGWKSQGGYGGSWQELADAHALSSSLASAAATLTAYTGASYYKNVPEPTSGLMLMLGLALMGLKRKRA